MIFGSTHPAMTLSPGETVYNIVEIRQQIFSLLSRSSLARLMRVDRGCMREVVKELYRDVRFDVAERASYSDDPVRWELYINSVVEIDARSMILHEDMCRIRGWQHFTPGDHLDRYDPETFNFIVPYLRHRYPALRKIVFGKEPGWLRSPDSPFRWVVTFIPLPHPGTPPPRYNRNGYIGTLGGTIDIFAQRKFDLQYHMVDDPLERIAAPSAPEGSYTVNYRFDMDLGNQYPDEDPPIYQYDDDDNDNWLLALREIDGIENLYTRLTIKGLPIAFEDLASLYLRQITAGHAERLQHIIVDELKPWGLSCFAFFGKIASTSLTTLEIIGRPGSPQPITTFSDLPVLAGLVRNQLPNLQSLAMGMKEITGAEAACKKWLTAEGLHVGGTVQNLRIKVWQVQLLDSDGYPVPEDEGPEEPVTPFFNIIRVLSALCTADATVAVTGPFSSYPLGDQTAYLHYLRRQPSHCQRHLAIADFEALGLASIREVLTVDYDEEGRPYKPVANPARGEEHSRTARWNADLRYYGGPSSYNPMTRTWATSSGASSCAYAAAFLDEVPDTAAPWEKLRMAEDLLKHMVPLKAEVDRLNASLDVEGVRTYVESLRAEVGRRLPEGGAS